MRVFRLRNVFKCNYNELNHCIFYHAVKLSQLLKPYENSANMAESEKNCDVSGKSCTVCLFDDNDFDEKIGVKLHLQPLDLEGELIILIFYLIG